jgi:peptidoglycan/LPS O-acetylase OafA/YrhL
MSSELSARAPVLIGPFLIAISLLALIPVAVLSYRLIEEPGIAIGHWINGRLGLQAPPSQTP